MVKKILIFLLLSRIAIYLAGKNIISFANQWDSPHYLYLAKNWYTNVADPANFIVFLPLYPFLIKIFGLGFIDHKIISLFVSNIFFILGGLIFYKLLRMDYSGKFSVLVLVLMSIFPTSFFFSSAYPESLYLFLFSLSLYLIRKNHLAASFTTAFLLTLTRPFGILIWLPLLIESLLVSLGMEYLILGGLLLEVGLGMNIKYLSVGLRLQHQQLLGYLFPCHL